MTRHFGAVCTDCFTPYRTTQWRYPFLCPQCAYREVESDRYLSWLRREVA